MTCNVCADCVVAGELVTFELPGGVRIQVCDTCAPTCPGRAVASMEFAEEEEEVRDGIVAA